MKEIKIRYFYREKEITIEDFRELEKKYTFPLQYKKELKEDELYIYLKEPINSILMDEDMIFPKQFFPQNNCNSLRYKISPQSKNEGVKYNSNKPKLSMLFIQFPDALKAIVKCSEYGHEKYKEFDKDFLNFKKVEGGSKAFADSGLRHRIEKGLDESGLPHQYHVAWNALAELQMWIEEQELKTEK